MTRKGKNKTWGSKRKGEKGDERNEEEKRPEWMGKEKKFRKKAKL